MKKAYRLAILLVAVAIFLVVTGLHKRMNEEIVYGPVIGIVLGFSAGTIKKGIASGIFWRLFMPVYQVMVARAEPDWIALYSAVLENLPLTLLVISFCVVGAWLNILTRR